MPKKKKKTTKPTKTVSMEFREITMSLGMTIPLREKYSSFRIDLGASVRRPDGKGYNKTEADAAIRKLEVYLEDKITEAAADMRQEED